MSGVGPGRERPSPGSRTLRTRGARRPRAAARCAGAALGSLLVVAAACSGPAGAPPAPAPAATAAPEPAPIEAARAPASLPYAPQVDVLHYDVEVGVSDRAPTMEGRATLRVRARRDDPELPLDLTGLAVRSVTVDGTAAEHAHRDGVLRVPLRGVGSGAEAQVEVRYGGTPDDGLAIGAHVHGAPSAFVDNWPNRTRFWLPSVDHPSDKATVRYTIHAPAAWDVIANGYLVREPAPTPPGALGPEAGPRRTWVWEVTVPIPTYTMVFGAADMEIRSVGRAACGRAPASREADGCVDVTWWAFPEDTAFAARVFDRADEMTDFFTDLVGPYPYEKLANVQSGTRFGGMENSSAIFYSGQGIASGSLGEGTVSHEIAHQWFGDAVTEAEWSHLWLSEGFATYFGALFFQEADGEADFRRRMAGSRATYLASDDVDRPVVHRYENLYDLLNRNSYQKGGWILHMLRGMLGDDRFFAGVRDYYRAHLHGTALSEDFRRSMEAASGRDLGWFFQQWLHEPGYPVFEIDHAYHTGRREVELRVRQVQPASWPRFRVETEVALVARDGSVARHPVVLEGAEQLLRLSASEAPVRVVLDPDEQVLKGDTRTR